MKEKTKVINGIQITDITKELTKTELEERANFIADGIVEYIEHKKDKTA